MRFSLDHRKTSVDLNEKLKTANYRLASFNKLIPMNYYPQLETREGMEFMLRHISVFGLNEPLLKTFQARGMSLNTGLEEDGRTLLHCLMEDPVRYSNMVHGFARLDGVNMLAKTKNGKTPLDLFVEKGIRSIGGSMQLFVNAEAAAISDPAAAKAYRLRRLEQLIHVTNDGTLLDIIPSQIKITDMTSRGSVLRLLVESNKFFAVDRLLDARNFKCPKGDEDLTKIVMKNASSPLPLIKKMVAKGFKLNFDVLNAAVSRQQWPLIEYALTAPASVSEETQPKEYRVRLYKWFLENKLVDCAIEAKKHRLFSGWADLDAPVFEKSNTLLMQMVAASRLEDVKNLLNAGARLDITNAEGKTAVDIAKTLRNAQQLNAMLLAHQQQLYKSGDYQRLDQRQIAWKSGVLTYIFDFNAGQVVVRDNATNQIAMQPMAEFSKSGAAAVSQAAKMLGKLGGDAGAHAQDVSRIEKKPAKLKDIPKL